jgi:heat-inducible transcriptional repressor
MSDEQIILSARQSQILVAVIEEFISTSEAVGSETLDKKFNLGVSPATIRNDMVRLTKMGLLQQPHTSSGRTPTPVALRYYVNHLMKQKDLSVIEEVAVKEKIWDYRQKVDKLLREATKALAEKTKALALTATDTGDLYYSGTANILEMPEFYDFELTHNLLAMLDKYDYWWGILGSHADGLDIMIGDDIGSQSNLSRCGFIYSKFTSPHCTGAICVIGPSRLNYQTIIPTVRYMGSLIIELTTW